MARNKSPARLTLLRATLFGLAVLLVTRVSGGEISLAPDPGSLEHVTMGLDRAEGYLNVLVEELEDGRPWLAKTALRIYTRQISKLHLELGRTRIQKQDHELGLEIAGQLKAHRNRLQAMDEIGHPELAVALTEALGHLTSAIDMLDQMLISKRRIKFRIRFVGPNALDPATGRAIDSVTERRVK